LKRRLTSVRICRSQQEDLAIFPQLSLQSGAAISQIIQANAAGHHLCQGRRRVAIIDVARSENWVVLQKIGRDIKGLTRTPTYTAMLKRLDTNLTCPRMSPLPTPSICPFLMMFIVSYPLIVRRAVLKLKKPSPGLTRRFVG